MEAESQEDFPNAGRQWRDAIDIAGKAQRDWEERAKRVVKRYRDERPEENDQKKFNILWSNVQTQFPALYAQTPKPQVSRRFKQKDELGKNAAMVLERALAFSADSYDFDGVMRAGVEDFLLPGRAVSRVRYIPQYGTPEGEEAPPVEYEEAQCEYHFWQDFRHGPGRKWEDVPWVAFRHYPDKATLEKYFGEEVAKDIPLDYSPDGREKDGAEQFKKAVLWEIWSKTENKVHWLAYSNSKVVSTSAPPLQLHGFFPTPKPLFSLVTNDSMVPVPDYAEYQDQADELDELSARIGILVKALRVSGLYAADAKEDLSSILLTGTENRLYPVDSWAAFAEKGGIRGMVEYLPIEQIINVVQGLYEARDRTKQELYEITGLSDIIRGASNPNETATAQRIKGQFGSLRLQDRQKQVARFARDLFRLKAEVICENFSIETLVQMTGLEFDEQMWLQIGELLKNDPMRTFKIDIETESTLQADEQADKEARIEFIQGMTGFMQQAGAMVAESEEMKPVIAEMMMFAVRGFKAGRELEDVFETAMEELSAAPEDMTPEQQQAQQQEQEKQQIIEQLQMRREEADIANIEADGVLKQIEAQERQLGLQYKQGELQLLPLTAQKTQAEIGQIGATTQKTTVEAQKLASEQPAQPEPVDPIDRELERGEKLARTQDIAAGAQGKLLDMEERRAAMKAQNRVAGGKVIKMVRGPDGSLTGEITDANGDVTRASVTRDESGNLEGIVE